MQVEEVLLNNSLFLKRLAVLPLGRNGHAHLEGSLGFRSLEHSGLDGRDADATTGRNLGVSFRRESVDH